MWELLHRKFKIAIINILRALLEKLNHTKINEYSKKGYGHYKKERNGNNRNKNTL